MKLILLKRKTRLSMLFLFFISALVYLPYAMKLTYYLDDWYYIYDGIVAGSNIFHSMFSVDRPMRGYFFDLYFSLLGPYPLLYHIGSYVWRLLAGLSSLWLLNILWVDNKRFNFYVAVLFVLFPGFPWWVSAIEYQPMVASLAIQVLSVVFTLKTLHAQKLVKKTFFMVGAIISGWIYIGLVDYAIGMEVFRLSCVYLALRHDEQGIIIASRTKLVLIKTWAWNFIIPIGFVYWRVFLFQNKRKTTDISFQLKELLEEPSVTLKALFANFFDSVANVGFHAWGKQIYFHLVETGSKMSNINWLLAGGVLLLTVVATFLLNNEKMESNLAKESIFLGFISLLFGVLPVAIFNRHVNLTYYSHYGLPASLTSAILLVGLIFYIIPSEKVRSQIIIFFVTTSALTNSLIAEKTLALENTVESFWWQVSWRIPALLPDTTLVPLYPNSNLVDNYELGLLEPVNLIYFPETQSEIPIRYPVATLVITNWNVDAILERNNREIFKFRTNKAVVNYENYLVLSQPTHFSCVHVIDGTRYILSENDPVYISKIAMLSNIENVRTKFDNQAPPEFAFGPEPDHGWCYFFEKADLAVQKLDWDEAANLGDTAIALGLYTSDFVEWFPFIQAYAMLGDKTKLEMISQQTNSSISFNKQVCEVFFRPDSVFRSNLQSRNLIEELFCE